MEDSDIKKMFRLAAQIRSAGPADPRVGPAALELERLTGLYVAEELDREPEMDWREAVSYLAGMFNSMAEAGVPDSGRRAACFEAIVEALAEKNEPAKLGPDGTDNRAMENEKKIYAVVACDRSDTADGTPVKLGQFRTRDEACQYVLEDMREKCDEIAPATPTVYDEAKMYYEDGDMSTQYGIVEVEL